MTRPIIYTNKTASVELIYLCHNSTVENVFHVTKADDYTLSDLQDVRDIVDAWENTYMAPYRSNESTLIRIRTKGLQETSPPTEDFYLPTPRVGGYGALAYPNNVTLAFKKSTAVAGRSYRGRWYLVAIPTNFYSVTNRDEMRGDLVAAYKGILDQLIAALDDGGHTLSVLSLYTDGDWRSEGYTTPVLEFVAVNNQYDSQRRRLLGRGI